MSKLIPFDVLMHAENSLSASEETYEILQMWLDSISDSDKYHSEARRVSAVMSLLHIGIEELVKALEVAA